LRRSQLKKNEGWTEGWTKDATPWHKITTNKHNTPNGLYCLTFFLHTQLGGGINNTNDII